MSLFVEFHLIQNFAPSNLNRDDTGAPKDAIFGGYRRARVSSQCFKRAIRLHPEMKKAVPTDHLAVRTKKLGQLLEKRLAALGQEDAASRIEAALHAIGLKLKDGKTEYLLFLGQNEIDAFAQLINKHWDALGSVSSNTDEANPSESNETNHSESKGSKKSKKSKKESGLPAETINKMKSLLDGHKAVDVALFGRMLANLPQANQDAACQVAHAISTHKVEREFDYFTAVDDEGDEDESGASMIGHIEFNSATFYRYAVVDVNKLADNLKGDHELALAGLRGFTQAMARAIPTGKQNTFAAYNLPSFVGVVLRHSSPFNLANAFEKPVWPKADRELSALSVARLSEYDKMINDLYGDGKDIWGILDMTGVWPADKGERLPNLEALAHWVECQVRGELGI